MLKNGTNVGYPVGNGDTRVGTHGQGTACSILGEMIYIYSALAYLALQVSIHCLALIDLTLHVLPYPEL